jgi:SAM-dependent methyltransferase
VRTQHELADRLAGLSLDPALSWTEAELPQALRTKHVHPIHPYLGKYVPQLVEHFLHGSFKPGQRILDPLCGSGTTLVEASVYGCPSTGVDISAFNCMLSRAKTEPMILADLKAELEDALAKTLAFSESLGDPGDLIVEPVFSERALALGLDHNVWLSQWFAPRALSELCFYRGLLDDYHYRDQLSVLLSRAARSARLVPHYNLDHPDKPCREPYRCYKHKGICQPTQEALKFLRRYTPDMLRRIDAYQELRKRVAVEVIHADARSVSYPHRYDGIITSPPYPGRIDYHEQHRYAYELLGLNDLRALEIGAAAQGRSKRAVETYAEAMTAVFANARRSLKPGATAVVIVEDTLGLYDQILENAGLRISERRLRHVNRRTGLRQGEFFEEIILARPA